MIVRERDAIPLSLLPRHAAISYDSSKGWYDSRMITNGASSIWTSNPKNANNLRLSQKWARLDESHMTWFLTNKDQIHKDSHFLISKKKTILHFLRTRRISIPKDIDPTFLHDEAEFYG